MEFSSEFWAAIAGALVGGGISALLQLAANRSARKAKKADDLHYAKSQARSLLFKVIKIESDFLHLREHSVECRERASSTGMEFGWASFLPLASLPRPLAFTNDEMAALARCKKDDLFNEVLALDEVHASIIELMALYRTKRMELSESLPADMSGSIGTITLSEDQFRTVAPRMTEIDLLAKDIVATIEKESAEPMAISKRLVAAFNEEFGTSVSLETKSQIPQAPASA